MCFGNISMCMLKCYSASKKFDYLQLFEPGTLDQSNLVVIDEWAQAQDLSTAKTVLFFTTETLPYCGNWEMQISEIEAKFNIKRNRLIFVCGGSELDYKQQVYQCPLGPNKVFYFNYFFNEVVRNNHQIGLNYDHTLPRAKLFDCLLGGRKPHRIFIYNRLIESGLLDKSVVNLNKGSPWEKQYFGGYKHLDLVLKGPGFTDLDHLPVYSSPELAQWEIKDVANFKNTRQNDFYSADTLETQKNNFGYHPQVSALLPTEVYNNSHYSIVAETGAELSHFLSEKIAKPVFAKRIFVLFGSAGLLKHFRNLGFKTFDSILDESYDQEEDNFKRYVKAWEQCQFLATQDPVVIYNKAAFVLEHNQQHLLKWSNQLDKLRNFLIKSCDV